MTTGQYVTPQGLDIPSVTELLDEVSAEQRSTINPLLNTDADSPIGQLNGIFMSRLRMTYEILGLAWNGNNPDAAEGFLLETCSAITGTSRAPATRSKFLGPRKLRLTLNLNTFVPSGTAFHVLGDPSVSFHTTENVNGTAAGDYLVNAECDVTGPVTCNATTLTVISTAVVGLTDVINDFDAEPGTNQDNDPQLRDRRERELRATGSGTVDSIRADLLAIKLEDGSKPVLEAVVLENQTMFVDGNGLDPKSLECLVFDGISLDAPDDLIAQTIWDSKPAGIELQGTSNGTATDSLGNARTVPFSRPTQTEVYLKATLTLANVNQIPSQYLAAVQAAVIARFTERVTMGSVIRCKQFESAIMAIPGIDQADVQIGFNPPGTLGAVDTNLSLGVRQMGFIQTSGITVA